MESWTDFADALRGRNVITFDGPGVGASQTPVVPYSMPMLSDIAARVLDAVGIEKADVVGYSHGGAVAQQLAAISTWSSIPVLGCIDAPTLVICGDHDTAVPPANSRLLAARIRDARLVTIQAGHDLQKPGPAAIVAQLVEQFLDSETSVMGNPAGQGLARNTN
jgi:pimeloyl-ACP methyl ester carboxylesterase